MTMMSQEQHIPEVLESLLRCMGEGAIFLDKGLNVILLNDAAKRILGIGNIATGRPLWESVSEKCIVDLYAKLQSSNVNSEIESTLLRDGGIRSIKLRAAPNQDNSGKPDGWIIMVEDITQEKSAEWIKAEFISTTSHELRTPIASMKEAVMLVLDGSSGTITPAQDRFLSLIKRNIERLSEVIKNLLDISNLETGKFRLRMALCNLAELIEQTLGSMELLAKDRQLRLIPQLQHDLPIIKCDPERITQILVNLIGNAIKFTPQGGNVTVSANAIFCDEFSEGDERTIDEKGGPILANGIEIKIIDTGIGIEEKDLARLFVKFGQLEPSLTRKYGGTGLGLAISRDLVEMHGGRVTMESKVGEGTTVRLTLPV